MFNQDEQLEVSSPQEGPCASLELSLLGSRLALCSLVPENDFAPAAPLPLLQKESGLFCCCFKHKPGHTCLSLHVMSVCLLTILLLKNKCFELIHFNGFKLKAQRRLCGEASQ